MDAQKYLMEIKKIDTLIKNKNVEVIQAGKLGIDTSYIRNGIKQLEKDRRDIIENIQKLNEAEYDVLHKRYVQGDNARDRVAQIFNNLSPELREYVQTQRGLIEIAGMDGDKLNFEKARFIKSLPRIRQSKRTRQELPERLAKLIQGTDRKLLGGD